MTRFVVTAIITGFFFGIMDGMIYGNPYAARLMEVYRPLARKNVKFLAGMATDLLSGFIISAVFYLIMPVLPSDYGLIQGLLYGVILWYFKVFMNVTSDWMMFNIPRKTLFYILLTGLAEMIILGVTNGLMLKDKLSISGADVFN